MILPWGQRPAWCGPWLPSGVPSLHWEAKGRCVLLFTSSILYNVQFSIKWDSKSSARVREPTTVELVGIGAPGAPLKAARATWSGSRSLRSLQVHARARALVLDVLYRCCDYVPIPICTNHVQSEATGGCHCEWSRSLRSLQGTKMCDACVLFFSKFYIDVVIMSQYLFARTMLNQKPRTLSSIRIRSKRFKRLST